MLVWPIITAIAISVASALFLSRKGPLKKAGTFLLSQLGLAAAAGAFILRDFVLADFSRLTTGQDAWNVLMALTSLLGAALVAGGLGLLGFFVKSEIAPEPEKKA